MNSPLTEMGIFSTEINESGLILTSTALFVFLTASTWAGIVRIYFDFFSLNRFLRTGTVILVCSGNFSYLFTLDLLLYELNCEKMPGSTSLLAEPLGPSLGIQAQLPILLAEYPFRTQQDIADYLHLLQDLPRYFSDLIALEQEKSRQGVFQNDLAVDGIIRQCSAFLADADTPESHLLHTVFQNKLQASSLFSEAERNLCLQTHEKLLISCVFPAYRSLSDALSSLRGKGTQNAVFFGIADGASGRGFHPRVRH